jgi:hypothetical protein
MRLPICVHVILIADKKVMVGLPLFKIDFHSMSKMLAGGEDQKNLL